MSAKFQVNCDQCGQFISKEDVFSGDLLQEDVSDGIEYGPPHYAVTCRKCMGDNNSSQEVELAVQ